MAIHTSENLEDAESITDSSARLTGYDIASTGTEDVHVLISGGEQQYRIVIPAGGARALSAMNEPFPDGMSIKRFLGDGIVVSNVTWQSAGGDPVSTPDKEIPPLGESDE